MKRAKRQFALEALSFALATTMTICGAPAGAQTYMFDRADFATGQDPSFVVTGDFNADGSLDMAVANAGGSSISILLGTLDGGFGQKTDYPAGPSPTWLIAVDLNGDEILDLVAANTRANVISVMLGNGDGSFQAPASYPSGGQPDSLGAADINGDGKMDLAVANSTDNTVSVFLGRGDGSFDYSGATSVGTRPSWVSSADFNGDGKMDFIVSNSSSATVSVLLNRGDGTLDRVDSPSGIFATSSQTSLALGDFNGDGKADAVVTSPWSNQITVLSGNGDGTFQSPSVNYTSYQPITVSVGDLNHDGRLDLVWTGSFGYPSVIFVMLGNGDGTFHESYRTSFLGSASAAKLYDFNKDGHPDMALPSDALDSVSLLLGNGDGTFGARADFPLPAADSVGPALVADFNNDGNPDVAEILHKSPAGSIAVLLGKGDGTFQNALSSALIGEAVNDATVGDFDGDGKADIATLNFSTTDLSVYRGNGDGTFQSAITSDLGALGMPQRLRAGNFNGDTGVDLAVTLFNFMTSENWLNVLISNGNGSFHVGFQYRVPGFLVPVPEVAEFNHDARLDLSVTDNDGVLIFLGNGDGTFGNPVTYGAGGFFKNAVSAADFDMDGNVDLALGTNEGVSLFLGNGDGTFRSPVVTSTPFSVFPVTSSDFSGDGVPDLVSTGNVGGAVFAFAGNGDGTFRSPVSFTAGDGAYFAAAGDFNSDGIDDLALPNQTVGGPLSPAVSVFLTAPVVSFSAGELQFAAQDVGTASSPQVVTLANIGNGPLSVASIVSSGDFASTSACQGSINVGQNCTISIRFMPTVAGPRVGAMTVSDNATSKVQTISLTGTGKDFSLSADPTTATISAGQSATYTLTISPLSGFTGHLSLSCSGGPTSATCSVSPLSVTLDGINSVTATVTVTTVAAGAEPPYSGRRRVFEPRLRVIPALRLFCFLLTATIGGLVLLQTPVNGIRTQVTPKLVVPLQAIVVWLVLSVSCGSGSGTTSTGPSGSQVKTYTLNVTASSQTTSHTVSLTLKVK